MPTNPTTRIERLREYERQKGPRGESYSKQNLDYWSARASENSDGSKHRALSGKVQLHDTGGPVHLPSTGGGEHEPGRLAGAATGIGREEAAMRAATHENAKTVRRPSQARPVSPRAGDGETMRRQAKRDLNHLGSDYEKNVRRSRE
jgi:hypothetical protein